MPNHVRNMVKFNGSIEELNAIKKMLAWPAPIQWAKGEHEFLHFNFHSIITPDKELWEEYNGPQPTMVSIEESLKFATNHWYDWNLREWGTKWNAYDTSVENNFDDEIVDGIYRLVYHFDTAWSPPENIIYALGHKLNEMELKVTFDWWFEEEQGWGGEMHYDGKSTEIVDQWDIPDSHSDYETRGVDCMCSDMGEKIFDDCPEEL